MGPGPRRLRGARAAFSRLETPCSVVALCGCGGPAVSCFTSLEQFKSDNFPTIKERFNGATRASRGFASQFTYSRYWSLMQTSGLGIKGSSPPLSVKILSDKRSFSATEGSDGPFQGLSGRNSFGEIRARCFSPWRIPPSCDLSRAPAQWLLWGGLPCAWAAPFFTRSHLLFPVVSSNSQISGRSYEHTLALWAILVALGALVYSATGERQLATASSGLRDPAQQVQKMKMNMGWYGSENCKSLSSWSVFERKSATLQCEAKSESSRRGTRNHHTKKERRQQRRSEKASPTAQHERSCTLKNRLATRTTAARSLRNAPSCGSSASSAARRFIPPHALGVLGVSSVSCPFFLKNHHSNSNLLLFLSRKKVCCEEEIGPSSTTTGEEEIGANRWRKDYGVFANYGASWITKIGKEKNSGGTIQLQEKPVQSARKGIINDEDKRSTTSGSSSTYFREDGVRSSSVATSNVVKQEEFADKTAQEEKGEEGETTSMPEWFSAILDRYSALFNALFANLSEQYSSVYRDFRKISENFVQKLLDKSKLLKKELRALKDSLETKFFVLKNETYVYLKTRIAALSTWLNIDKEADFLIVTEETDASVTYEINPERKRGFWRSLLSWVLVVGTWLVSAVLPFLYAFAVFWVFSKIWHDDDLTPLRDVAVAGLNTVGRQMSPRLLFQLNAPIHFHHRALEITADSFTNLIKATLRDTPRSDVDLVSTGDSTQPAQADEDHARGTPRAFAKALTLESLREKYVTQAFSSVLLFGGLAYFVLLPALVQGVGPNFFENIGFRKPAQKFREEYSKALLSWFPRVQIKVFKSNSASSSASSGPTGPAMYMVHPHGVFTIGGLTWQAFCYLKRMSGADDFSANSNGIGKDTSSCKSDNADLMQPDPPYVSVLAAPFLCNLGLPAQIMSNVVFGMEMLPAKGASFYRSSSSADNDSDESSMASSSHGNGRRRNPQKTFYITPGGFPEVGLNGAERETVFLEKRKGVIKHGLRHGFYSVSVYTVGERETYATRELGIPTMLRKVLPENFEQKYLPSDEKVRGLSNQLSLPFAVFLSKYFPAPNDVELKILCGPGLQLPHIPNPTRDEVNYWHGLYVSALKDLLKVEGVDLEVL